MSGKDNASETLAKGLRVLDLFGNEEGGFTLGQIASQVGINKTSVYRYVNTLCEMGFLRQDERTRLYRTGARMLALAHAMLERSELVKQVRPLVDEVRRTYDLHVDVGILAGGTIHLVYRRESRDTRAFRSFISTSELHYLATGKAALAFMEPDEREACLQNLTLTAKTDKTITDKTALLADLEKAREKGYALNNEEFVPGLIAIAAPLFSLRTGKVVGGVSFDATTDRFSMKEFEIQYGGYIVELAKKIAAVASL
ncbi:transcriptional regulator, IclR family [Desulfovibrio sp. X2]|uniref:IclR family transcriptional regulator n=1 Tax=Desulfovibrio sp. X2 TaxID=941449 RepID=UPI000358DDD4|nr:IclR family transcriptional regulator [Desulfovibrio sp. X2]EPR43486.1 transcriptional regulator, IclR family [Desulfovibrio sp. X2]